MEQQTQQLKIEKDIKEKLKLYLLILRDRQFSPFPGERLKGILAYRAEDALQEVKEKYSKPNLGFFYTGDYILPEELLRRIETKGIVISVPKEKPTIEPKPILPPQTLGVEGLKAGLLMAADNYLDEEQDRIDLKRLINKIKNNNNT